MSRLRAKLAAEIEKALLEQHNIRGTVNPQELYPAQGWYRSNLHADCWRWDGVVRWHLEGGSTEGLSCLIGSFDTMTNCVKRGVTLNRERATSFEAHATGL